MSILQAIINGQFEFPAIHCYDCTHFKFIVYHLLGNEDHKIECFERCPLIKCENIELCDEVLPQSSPSVPTPINLGPL